MHCGCAGRPGSSTPIPTNGRRLRAPEPCLRKSLLSAGGISLIVVTTVFHQEVFAMRIHSCFILAAFLLAPGVFAAHAGAPATAGKPQRTIDRKSVGSGQV